MLRVVFLTVPRCGREVNSVMVTSTTSIVSSRELILANRAWQSAMRSLLVDDGRFAIGPLRWNQSSRTIEWMVDHLDIVHAPPQGNDRWPLTDWVVLVVERSPRTPHELLREMALRASQTVVVVRISQASRDCWEGLVHCNGEVFPLDGLRIAGPRMLRMERTSEERSDEFPTEGRWSRTAGALGASLWKQVHNSHVLLIGCGRNGTMAAWQLAGLGVSRMTLVDPDRLESSNLDAMPGLRVADVGQPKSTALARRLVKFNPE